jgi:hypothetical protein
MEFFTQALNYNNGDLTNANTKPISTKSLGSSYIALICATLATFALIGLLGSLAGILISRSSDAGAGIAYYKPRLRIKSKEFAIYCAIATVTSFVGAYVGSRETLGLNASNALMSRFLPIEPGHMRLYFMVIATAVCGALLFGVFTFLAHRRKDSGKASIASLSDMNIKIGVKNVFKMLGISAVLFIVAYILTAFVSGAFSGRFQFVDGSLELMKPYSFIRMIKYMVFLLPFTALISTLNNLTIVEGVSDSMATAISVFVNSIGVWLFIIVAYASTFSSPDHMTALGLHTMLPTICLVPILNYIYRKLYKITGNIWCGAFFAAIFLDWRMAGYISHRFMFWGYDSVISRFLGF